MSDAFVVLKEAEAIFFLLLLGLNEAFSGLYYHEDFVDVVIVVFLVTDNTNVGLSNKLNESKAVAVLPTDISLPTKKSISNKFDYSDRRFIKSLVETINFDSLAF